MSTTTSALSGDSTVVTGEAVQLDLPPASFANRSLGFVLDAIAMAMVLFLIFTILGMVQPWMTFDASTRRAISVVVTVLCTVLIPAAIETITGGKSLGKLAIGNRVVRDDGGPVRWRHALVRSLVGMFELYATWGAVALIATMTNGRGKRLGDSLAGTYVIRERLPCEYVFPPQMPPELLGWAQSADIARIPDGLAVAARQVLLRSARLDPHARAAVTADMARQLGAFVAPQPPMPVPPDRYVSAVLVERRWRHLISLEKQRRDAHARWDRRRTASVLNPESSRLVEAPAGDPSATGPAWSPET